MPPSPLASSHHRKPTKKPWFLTPWKSKFLLLSMPSILLLSILSLSLFFSLSPSASARNRLLQPPSSSALNTACKSTRFPDLCQSSISQSSPPLPSDPTALQIIISTIAITTQNLKTAQTKVKSILDSSTENQNRSNAARTCLDILSYSNFRIQAAVDALSRDKIKDARAWMSAAHVYHYDCWSELKYVNGTKQVGETMAYLDTLVQYSSNALSMMMAYDSNGNKTASWVPPKTERNGFYGPVSGGGGSELGFDGGIPSDLKTDVTVCKDGSGGCYLTVQEAVNASPDDKPGRPFVVRIKEGVYEEIVRVPFEKKNVVFLGDSIGKTVITGSLSVGNTAGMTTYRSATVAVLGDGFMASGITFRNTAGPDGHQAVAFRSESDLSIIENCEFIGNQDTLYAHTLRQFYIKCRIQGNVDFIFGHSAAIFQDCEVLVAPRQVQPEKGENNAITAHGRIDPAQTTGFVFHNCLINGTDEYMKFYNSKPEKHKNFLGRPWKEYSRTVFIQSTLEALVHPNGWMPFRGDFALKTLFYGECQNSGSGSDMSKRVTWSSRIPAEGVSLYSVQNFIQGNEWIPKSS